MKTGRDTLCDMILHAGSMCLLDGVESWDDERIICTARSHRSADNPLRLNGRLSVVHVLEYGAQAIAVHGGLAVQEERGRIVNGYVAAIRKARFHVDRLDVLEQPLTLEAVRLISSGANQVYRIEAKAANQPVADAQIAIMNAMETDR